MYYMCKSEQEPNCKEMLFLSADHTNVVDCGPMRLNSVQPLSLHIASEIFLAYRIPCDNCAT